MRADRVENIIKKCPACGSESQAFAAFCISCGEPFEPEDDLPPDWGNDAQDLSPTPREAHRKDHPSAPGGLGRREAVIGIALLVFVVAVALYQWHKSDEQAAAYRQGVAAEQNRDWDKAAQAYALAGDHPDAASKARAARQQIADRDRDYTQGIAAEHGKEWDSAIQAFEAVMEIQPGYQDTEQRLQQARKQSSLVPLGGLMLRETKGADAGLYYLDEAGDKIRLPGSDEYSVVRGISQPGSCLVYDRPTARPMASTPGAYAYVASDAGQRELALASISVGTVKSRTLRGLDASGSGIFTSSGLWWTATDPATEESRTWYIDTVSESAGAAEITGANVQGSILAFDAPHALVVWGQPLQYNASGHDQTVITMTGAQGALPWLVTLLDGKVVSASVSRDGQWLLATTMQQNPAGGSEQTVWAQSLEMRWDPYYSEVAGKHRKLASMQISEGAETHMSATFLPSDATPARVMVDRIENGVESLTIYTLDSNAASEVGYSEPSMPGREDKAGFSNEGRLLASPRRYGQGTRMELFDLSVPNFKSWFKVPLPVREDQPVQMEFAPHNNYVVATVQKYRNMTDLGSQEVYAANVGKDSSLSPAKLIATGLLNGYPTVAPAPGGTFLAYVDEKEELHAVRYDGTGDVYITGNVAAIWSLGNDTDLSWAR